MSEGDLDKSDPASSYKLEKAREKGSVAKSQDAAFVALLFGTACMVYGMGDQLTRKLVGVLHGVLSQVSRSQWDVHTFGALIAHALTELMWVLSPFFSMLMVLAIAVGVWQVGFTISAEPLKPDFQRVNPAEGFKRLFSLRSTYELLRSTVKLGVVAVVLWVSGEGLLKQVTQLMNRDPGAVLRFLIHEVGGLVALLTAVMLILSLVDVGYTRWEFLRKMRMSKREVKDEHKNREGDPRIKARLRELRIEWLKKSLSSRRVAEADVLVTNPTHYAVAISYERDKMPAPKVLAKGSGDVALRMRDVARRHGVPIVENPPLARSLHRLSEADDYLPEQHYSEVARILVWVMSARAARLKSA